MPNFVNVVCGGPVTYCAKNHKFGDFRRMRREGRERARGGEEGTETKFMNGSCGCGYCGGGRKMNRRRRIKSELLFRDADENTSERASDEEFWP